jgi:hypothetical protein
MDEPGLQPIPIQNGPEEQDLVPDPLFRLGLLKSPVFCFVFLNLTSIFFPSRDLTTIDDHSLIDIQTSNYSVTASISGLIPTDAELTLFFQLRATAANVVPLHGFASLSSPSMSTSGDIPGEELRVDRLGNSRRVVLFQTNRIDSESLKVFLRLEHGIKAHPGAIRLGWSILNPKHVHFLLSVRVPCFLLLLVTVITHVMSSGKFNFEKLITLILGFLALLYVNPILTFVWGPSRVAVRFMNVFLRDVFLCYFMAYVFAVAMSIRIVAFLVLAASLCVFLGGDLAADYGDRQMMFPAEKAVRDYGERQRWFVLAFSGAFGISVLVMWLASKGRAGDRAKYLWVTTTLTVAAFTGHVLCNSTANVPDDVFAISLFVLFVALMTYGQMDPRTVENTYQQPGDGSDEVFGVYARDEELPYSDVAFS